MAAVLAACVLLPALAAARNDDPAEKPFTEYTHPIAEFLDDLAPKEGLKVGVAGYWHARVITLMSRTGTRAFAVTPSMEPFLWVSNADWYKPLFGGPKPHADFVVLDDPLFHLDAPYAYKVFGPPARTVKYQGIRVLIYRCNTCSLSPQERARTWMDEPLSQSAQELTSSRQTLTLRPSEHAMLDVTVRNPGTEAWASTGKRPVNVSYKIYRDNAQIFEGGRTELTAVLAGGESTDVKVRITAPHEAGTYKVRISLVQERIGWLMDTGGNALDLPLEVR